MPDAEPPEDPTHEALTAAEAFEEFERPLWAYYLAPTRDDVSEALYACEEAVREGRRPTAEEITEARRALDDARKLVEEHYAALASAVEPWDDGVGRSVPYRALIEQLQDADYTVEKSHGRR